MKKILFIGLALVTATSVFALPPPKLGNGPGTDTGGGPCLIPPIRKDFNVPYGRTYEPASPSRDVANAVAITGIVATGLRVFNELTAPPPQPIIIIDQSGSQQIYVIEQAPKTAPVPISTQPIEIIKPSK